MAILGDTKAVSLNLLDGVVGDLNPKITDSYDLGTSSLKWRNIYGALKGNADTATAIKDKSNGTLTYLNYSASGMTTTSWVGSWDGYTLKAISPQNLRNTMGLGNTTGALPVANGGTGATTAENARTNLGLGSMATETASNYIPKSIGTTKGDIIYWSAASTPVRLGIGSAGQVLKVSSDGVPVWSSDNNSITGVKGNAESSYRTGNVNLTPANILGTSTTGKFWRGDNNWSNILVGQHTVSLSTFDKTNGGTNAWNKDGNYNLSLKTSNNVMIFTVGGTENDRNANIQVGHADSTNYANVTGNLYLNKLGGQVYINENYAAKVTSATSGQVMVADGTTGSIKTTGYTIATSVPSGAVFTDTKNTAGSTDTSSKIYLIGATSQATNPQTYSDNEVFVTDGTLSTKNITVSGNTTLSGETEADSLTVGNLQVNGSATFVNTINGSINGNAATATTAGGITSAGTTAQFWRGDNSWSNILTQTATTTLGIDTSNSKIGTAIRTLHIATINAGSGAGVTDGQVAGLTFGVATAAYAGIYYQSSGNYGSRLYFATTGSFANGAYARMMITHDGKVGIGTTSPSTLLHVAGDVTVTGLTASQAVSTDANKKLVSTNLTVSDPTASGTGITYIATISQSAVGKITVTKSTVRSASTSQTGVLQFTAENTNAQLNTLTTGSSTPTDADYYISQYVGGGTTTTTYHRRPMSALWDYIKGKITNGIYWANEKATSSASYKTTPEVAKIKLNGNTSASTASTKNVELVYDATLEVLNFVFS